MNHSRLSMQGVTKFYGNFVAIENISLDVKAGEIHALVGENGAGKSTLLNILSAVREADSGVIKVDGNIIDMKTPLSARNAGIAMIHQELQLIPELSVTQNMFLGKPLTRSKGMFVNKNAQYRKAKDVLERLDPNIDPNEPIRNLKVAQQQIVEIARALLDNAKIIAMDEPTSSLTPTEFERLAALILSLKKTGVSFVYVSHKMDEVFKVCDRATILRDGHYVDTVNIQDETEESIVTKMVGRKIEKIAHQSFVTDKEVLNVKSLARGSKVKATSFCVHAGEVLGISGLVGAGRTELLKLIANVDPKSEGEVFVDGQKVTGSNVASAIKSGIGLVPEERKKEGIIKERSVAINMGLPSLKMFTKAGLLQQSRLNNKALKVMSDLNLRPLDVERQIGTLSGGNQQKVIIGRWIAADAKVFLFDEPTRGIDIGAKSEIYNLIEGLAQAGKAIIVVSSEMTEIIRICDRVLVMKDGGVTAELSGDDINEEMIAHSAINNVAKIH